MPPVWTFIAWPTPSTMRGSTCVELAAAGLRRDLDLAGVLEGVHAQKGVGHGLADGQRAVVAQPSGSWRALSATAGGATWVSFHHGGGVGMGYSQHSGVVIVADGTTEADEKLARVLWNDPAIGVVRHADAGYELAKETARKHGLQMPAIPLE